MNLKFGQLAEIQTGNRWTHAQMLGVAIENIPIQKCNRQLVNVGLGTRVF